MRRGTATIGDDHRISDFGLGEDRSRRSGWQKT